MKKLLNNNFILIFIITLFAIVPRLNRYNDRFVVQGSLFSEICIVFLIDLVVNAIAYLILKKILKDKQSEIFTFLFLFNIIHYINGFYHIKVYFLLWLSIILLLDFINAKFDYFFKFVTTFSLILFVIVFSSTIGCFTYYISSNTRFDNNIEFKVDDNLESLNVYWVHCDGMMGIKEMKKYYNYDNETLINYFNENGYIYNDDVRLVAGRQTKTALPALFNPYYYDNCYNQFVLDLENYYLGTKKHPDIFVDYYELKEKREDNELLKALKKKGYTTFAIGSFDMFTSLHTDYYYHFLEYNYNDRGVFNKLEKLEYQDNKNLYDRYIYLLHLKNFIDGAHVSRIKLNDLIKLKSTTLDYNDLNIDEYKYANSTYLKSIKATFKDLDDIMKYDDTKFVFIEYNLNHFPLSYDLLGNKLNYLQSSDLAYYPENYEYTAHILIDILNYIKSNDENAVIVVQADHGIHVLKDEELENYFDISKEELAEIRNSVINAVFVPEKYKSEDMEYLKNPLNISRYLVNNFVGKNYDYIDVSGNDNQ